MQKQLQKTQSFIFLSNNTRKVIFIVLNLIAAVSYTQWLDAYIPDFKVNDDNLNSYQTNSVIGVDSAGNFVIAWEDVRSNPGEQFPTQIFCQRYNKDGLALGNNFRIGQDTVYAPKITMLYNGRFLSSWIRYFNGGALYELYFQRFNSSGISLSVPKRVIDTAYSYSSVSLFGTTISSDTSGNFIICWSKAHTFSGKKNTFFQRYDSTGVKIGGIDSVNEANSNAEFPSVAMNNDGSFVIAWQDDRTGGSQVYDIYLQRYSNKGIKTGSNVKVNDDNISGVSHTGCDISTNGSGYYIISWTDRRNNENGIYYQLYNSKGGLIGINRKANILSAQFSRSSSRVSMRNDRKYFIGWMDVEYSGGREQFYGRRFDSLGNAIGTPYMIPASSPSGTKQVANSLKVLGDKIYSTWHDNRNGGTFNYDIYCNVRGFQNPDTVIGIVNVTNTSNEFKLYYAYPNPFNPVSTIKYDIPKLSNVMIKIYDILGRVTAVLVNETKEPGYYNISFDGTNYSSGIYFCRIEARSIGSSSIGHSDVKKMVLIK